MGLVERISVSPESKPHPSMARTNTGQLDEDTAVPFPRWFNENYIVEYSCGALSVYSIEPESKVPDWEIYGKVADAILTELREVFRR